MKDVGSSVGVKNISDLVLKEIYGICETKNPSKEQVNEYKMIGDSEIPKCPKLEAKSKIGKIFKKHNPLKEYSVKIYEIDSYFYKHYEKKYKLIKMGVNIYYLELIFILVNVFQQQKLMKEDILTETLFLRKKDKKHQKKNLVVKLLELIQVMQKTVMIQIMRLVTQKHLWMSSKIKEYKIRNKRTRRQNK